MTIYSESYNLLLTNNSVDFGVLYYGYNNYWITKFHIMDYLWKSNCIEEYLTVDQSESRDEILNYLQCISGSNDLSKLKWLIFTLCIIYEKSKIRNIYDELELVLDDFQYPYEYRILSKYSISDDNITCLLSDVIIREARRHSLKLPENIFPPSMSMAS